ncbi:MAG: phage major capsid protein [Bauldia sp.]|nr:phage major capsid protein [Bauldia sp.]
MKTLEQLRSDLKKALGAITEFEAGIKDADGNPRDLTADEVKAHEKLHETVESIEANIKAVERSMAAKARNSKAADAPIEGADEERTDRSVPAAPKIELKPLEKAGLIGMAVAATAFARKDFGESVSPLAILRDNGFGSFAEEVGRLAKAKSAVIKTLSAGNQVSGGYLTPDLQNTDIIELLHPETTFLQGGPQRRAMPNGTYRQPAGASGVSASYRGEGTKIGTSEPTFREIAMSAKFLGVIVPMTRQMLDFSVPGARAFIEGDMREAMGQTLDAKAYFGAGDDYEPLGLVNQPGIQSFTVQGTTTATLAQIDAVFSGMMLKLWNSNIRNQGRWAWVIAPRTLEYLRNKRVGDDDGQFAYPSLQGASPTMRGIPVLSSTQIPINLGVANNESYILLVNFADTLFGITEDLMMAASTEASVTINGSLVSAFENDLVFVRAVSAHDIGLRRGASVVVCAAVKWGA